MKARINCNNSLKDIKIMGILNMTPDSFSDGGKFNSLDKALFRVEKMLNDGASIIDVGGESTRPDAAIVTTEQELERVIPIIEKIKANFDCEISVDTSNPRVMEQAAIAGMTFINDIRSLTVGNALDVAAKLDLPVCIMHMQGAPQNMQNNPQYQDIMAEVIQYLQTRAEQCMAVGIKRENIFLDPGFGFGKTMQHNFCLLKHTDTLATLGYPLLIGLSRKSMFGDLLGKAVQDRLQASVTGALIAAQKGAKIVRVHDVAETYDALRVWQQTI